MENQHRQIKGYKELDQTQIDLMNKIKEKAAEVGDLCAELQAMCDVKEPSFRPDGRWLATGRTDLQKGFMAVTRSVTKPDFF